MAMSRKDYVNLATAMGLELRNADPECMDGMRQMVVAVSTALKAGNTNFQRIRFLDFTDEVALGVRDAEGRKI